MSGESEREKGLRYIIHQLNTRHIITPRDTQTFLQDLRLPAISVKTLQSLMVEAGGSTAGLTKLSHFFVFVRNQLVYDDMKTADILKAFLMFDKDEVGDGTS